LNPAKPISRRRCSNNVQKFSRNDLYLLAHVDERYELGLFVKIGLSDKNSDPLPKSTILCFANFTGWEITDYFKENRP